MKSFSAFILVAVFSFQAHAQASNCGELRQELSAMKKAQQVMMESLVNNHETFASTMEEYSSSVQGAKGGALNTTISKKMNSSAQAFRERGLKGKKMQAQFNDASADLYERLEACLR